MVNGKTINAMALVFIRTREVLDTKAIGKMTPSRAKVLRLGQKAPSMSVNTKMARSRASAPIFGPMAASTRVSGTRTKFTELASTSGRTAASTTAVGRTMTWMVLVYTSILMA